MRVHVMWIWPAAGEAELPSPGEGPADENDPVSEEARTLMRLLRDLRDLRGYL